MLVIEGREPMNLVKLLPGVTTGDFNPWGEVGDNDPSGGSSLGEYTEAPPPI